MNVFKWIKEQYAGFRSFRKTAKRYTRRRYNVFEILIFWSKRHLSRFQFLIFAGILVGLTGGAFGVILKTTVHYMEDLIVSPDSIFERIIAYGVLPFIGIIITALIARYIYKQKADVKLSDLNVYIARNKSNVPKREMFSRLFQSAVTVGLGGSAGLETPMAVTGGAIGSNFAQRYRLDYKDKTLLLAGGVAAGIASAFNAPIAGIMFAFEVLLIGVVFTDFVPLVIAAIFGSLVTQFILKEGILFSFEQRSSFDYNHLGYYILLGILTGFYARYYLLINKKIADGLNKMRFGGMKRAAIGGIIVAVLCFLFPSLYGQGYLAITKLYEGDMSYLVFPAFEGWSLSSGWALFAILLMSAFFKPIATAATLNSGGAGGNFAPSMVGGGLLGYSFAKLFSLLGFNVPTIDLMMVSMAGVLAGVMYAPLTGIFLIVEIGAGYDLIIPLMIVTIISFLINKYFSPINPDLVELAREGKIFTTRHDSNIIGQLSLSEIVEKQEIVLLDNAGIEEINKAFTDTQKPIIAVVTPENDYVGIISGEKIFSEELMEDVKNKTAVELSSLSYVIKEYEKIESAVQQFDSTGQWLLPVVDKDGKFVGFASQMKFFKKYRALTKYVS